MRIPLFNQQIFIEGPTITQSLYLEGSLNTGSSPSFSMLTVQWGRAFLRQQERYIQKQSLLSLQALALLGLWHPGVALPTSLGIAHLSLNSNLAC